MHVVLVSDLFLPVLGGTESAVSTLLCSLPDVRFTVLTVQPVMGSAYPWGDNVVVRHMNLQHIINSIVRRLLPPSIRHHSGVVVYPIHELQVRLAASSTRADLVHLHSFLAFSSIASFAQRHVSRLTLNLADWLRDFDWYGHPLLFTDHSQFSGQWERFLSMHSDLLVERLRNVACVELSGKANVDRCAREKGLKVRTWWVPNPIDVQLFRPAPFPSTSKLIVGYAGRYSKEGLREIVELMNRRPDWVEFRLALVFFEILGENQ